MSSKAVKLLLCLVVCLAVIDEIRSTRSPRRRSESPPSSGSSGRFTRLTSGLSGFVRSFTTSSWRRGNDRAESSRRGYDRAESSRRGYDRAESSRRASDRAESSRSRDHRSRSSSPPPGFLPTSARPVTPAQPPQTPAHPPPTPSNRPSLPPAFFDPSLPAFSPPTPGYRPPLPPAYPPPTLVNRPPTSANRPPLPPRANPPPQRNLPAYMRSTITASNDTHRRLLSQLERDHINNEGDQFMTVEDFRAKKDSIIRRLDDPEMCNEANMDIGGRKCRAAFREFREILRLWRGPCKDAFLGWCQNWGEPDGWKCSLFMKDPNANQQTDAVQGYSFKMQDCVNMLKPDDYARDLANAFSPPAIV